MYWTSKKPWFRQAIADNLLNALSTVPGGPILATPTLRLVKQSISLSPTTPIANLVAQESGFTGYVKAPLGGLGVPLNVLPYTRGLVNTHTFAVSPAPTVTETVWGYFVDSGNGADWALAEMFPSGFPMANGGDFLELTVVFGILMLVPVS
jgi:hypothetical protein